MEKISWKKTVLPPVRERLAHFNERGIIPTLRAMFYALFSLHVIPNTESYYKSLSKYTARWRENGELDINCFVDQSRHVVEDFDDVYENPQEYLDRYAGHLEAAPLEYYSTIPRWHNQPHYVEVWTEKDAQVGLLRSILRGGTAITIDRQVRIVPSRGYSGPAFNFPNAQRLKAWQAMGKQVHIVYFGDMDPSGENIEEVVNDKLVRYGLVNIDFQRIAITDEQIDEYGLPRNPDPATLAKLERDSRRWQFRESHNGELFQVEVDALAALAPDAFRDLVLNSVDQFYDEDVYQDVLNEYTEDDIRIMLKKTVKDLARRL